MISRVLSMPGTPCRAKDTPLHAQLKPLLWSMRLMGVFFRSKRELSTKLNVVETFRFLVLIILLFFFSVRPTRLLLSRDFTGLRDIGTVANVIGVIWSAQSIIGFLYLLYWQRSGAFNDLLVLIHDKTGGRGCLKSSRFIFWRQVIFLFLFIGFMVVKFFFFNYLIKKPNSAGAILLSIVSGWAVVSWGIVLIFFSMCCYCVSVEIEYLNDQLAANSKKLREARMIQSYYLWHSDLCAIVRHLNDMFCKYIFVMHCTNIPLVILSLFAIIINRNHDDLRALIPLLFGCFYTILQMLTWSLTPARLHDQIHKARDLLFGEKSLWVPYEFEVFETAVMFCEKLGAGNEGITLWNYVVITRSLLMTVLSVVISYLFLLLQF